ncbi:hypothetical protein VTL71DRAFT_4180 [Oculimacula yallundae]|uniref:BZIP domain-containing protein n=1 Tax=Oculimacula yallundae TaxID=86028 RepID=A0ABR4C525_9HELO
MDSSMSNQSKLGIPSTNPEQQRPKNKVRGRPVKNSDKSKVPEQRRLQIRRAQEGFRNRKEAAKASLEAKNDSLQAIVRNMSNIFLDLSDSMIQSDAIHLEPNLGQDLASATSRFITLAKSAVGDSDNTADVVPDVSETSSNRDKTLSQPISGTFTGLKNDRRKFSLSPAPNIQILEDFNPVPETLLRKEIFGNGWFGSQPGLVSQLSPANVDLNRLDNSFGMKLLQTTLSVADESLMDIRGETGKNTFYYALKYHTREQLLFTLRWFLGPGIRTLRALGSAVFGFTSALSLQYLEAVNSGLDPKILNPLVDAQALVEVQRKLPISPYFNAFTVEDYMVSKGAYHMDEDVMFLRMVDDDLPGQAWSDTTIQYHSTPVAANAEGLTTYMPTLATDGAYGGRATSNITLDRRLPNGGWGGILRIDDTQIEKASANVGTDPTTQPSSMNTKFRTVSVPLLLQSLAKRGQCLGTGPGYLSTSVDTAIDISTLEYSS